MIDLTENDIDKVLEFLKIDMGNCLYLYLDLLKYGLDDRRMDFWIDGRDASVVVMKYFDSMQIYARPPFDGLDDVLALVRHVSPRMVSGPSWCTDGLSEVLGADGYEYQTGEVFEFTKCRDDLEIEYEYAQERDMEEVARLICTDAGFAANYSIAGLAAQLTERLRTGMGRNLVIRDGGKIIAHIATYAEHGGVAVTSGLVVEEAHRSRPYGFVLENELIKLLLNENFRIFTQVHDKRRIRLLKAQGHRYCGGYGKLTKADT